MAEDNAPIKHQIITIESDPLPFHYGGVMLNTDETLITRGGNSPYGMSIYDQIERDCHAYAVLNKRKMAVASKEWEVLPASSSRIDRKAADCVKAQLKNMNFDRVTVQLLDATLKGFSVGEVMWETAGTEIVAARVDPKTQRRFWMGIDGKPKVLTISNVWPGEDLPDRKFIVHRYGIKNDEQPYGLGLGYSLFWPTFFKRQDITLWLRFVDKFADPTTVGKYPSGVSDQDKTDLMQAMRCIGTDGRIVIPDNVLIELLEAKRSSSIDSYEKMARYMDEQISECVLGETLSTNLSGGGSLAAASVHDQVRMELAKADSDLLSDTVNDTLVKWIVQYNYPKAGLPKVWRDCEDPEDLKMRSDRDVNIWALGYEPDDVYVNETYGHGVGKWTKRAAPVEGAVKEPSPKPPRTTSSNFGEGHLTAESAESAEKGGRGTTRAERRAKKAGHAETRRRGGASRRINSYEEFVAYMEEPVSDEEWLEETGRTLPGDNFRLSEISSGHGWGRAVDRGNTCPHCSGFAEVEPDGTDVIMDRVAEEAMPMTDRMIDPIKRLVMRATSLSEIRDGLINLYGEMHPADLGGLIARAMTEADLLGRLEVAEEK
jgi:phage gp29-like protein